MPDRASASLRSLLERAGGLELLAGRPAKQGERPAVSFGPELFARARHELSNADLVGIRDELAKALLDHDRLLQVEAENRLLTEQVDVLRSALRDRHADESTIPSTFDFLPDDVRWVVLKDSVCLVNQGIDDHSVRVEARRLETVEEHRVRIGDGERFVYGIDGYGVVVDSPSPLDDVRCQLVRITLAQLASNRRQREQHELIERVRDLMEANRSAAELREAERRAVDKQVSDLIEETVRDSLTRVYNRSKVTAVASDLDEDRRSYAVVMADIDFFKTVNDEHGHLAGDRVIVEVAACLDNDRRPGDVIARWGGEEFIALLPSTSAETASEIAERWRDAIESQIAVEHQDVTCSFGVAAVRANQRFEQVLARADLALYRAKEHGRNRVEVHDERH